MWATGGGKPPPSIVARWPYPLYPAAPWPPPPPKAIDILSATSTGARGRAWRCEELVGSVVVKTGVGQEGGPSAGGSGRAGTYGADTAGIDAIAGAGI
jgi:hypothetical protein